MTSPDPAAFASGQWRKASRSTGGNQCVEVATTAGACAVRDSKNPAAGHLAVSGAAWREFLAALKHGSLGS